MLWHTPCAAPIPASGIDGEEEFKGQGVAYCATCDGEFFTGKEVFVVGGRFAAAEESVFNRVCPACTILIRGDGFTVRLPLRSRRCSMRRLQ